MKYLQLPDTCSLPLPFYLAAEEWAARCLPPDDYFFVWQVEPTVICGRHQDMEKEVDTDYCRRHGIAMVRRLSGGGAVYADWGNFMFSYITPGDEIMGTFGRYTTMVASMLRGIGIDAVATGRNDIVVGGRKISGNAFYHLPGRCIVHGTMLYTIDAERISGALTPSRAKLESKGVQSVPMRVTCLRELGCPVPLDRFAAFAVEALTDSVRMVTPDEVEQIREIERKYYLKDNGPRPRDAAKRAVADVVRTASIPGVGEVKALICLDSANAIRSVFLEGDFFLLSDIEAICGRLRGVDYSPGAIGAALAGADVGACIAGLSAPQLRSLLID